MFDAALAHRAGGIILALRLLDATARRTSSAASGLARISAEKAPYRGTLSESRNGRAREVRPAKHREDARTTRAKAAAGLAAARDPPPAIAGAPRACAHAWQRRVDECRDANRAVRRVRDRGRQPRPGGPAPPTEPPHTPPCRGRWKSIALGIEGLDFTSDREREFGRLLAPRHPLAGAQFTRHLLSHREQIMAALIGACRTTSARCACRTVSNGPQ